MNEKDFIICGGRIHICRICRRPVFSGFEKTGNSRRLYGLRYAVRTHAGSLYFGGRRKKDGQIASINLNSVLGSEAGFAIVKGKTLAEYADNSDRAEFYQTQCADKTVCRMNAPDQALGAPVPFAKLNGVGKVAADYSCLGK